MAVAAVCAASTIPSLSRYLTDRLGLRPKHADTLVLGGFLAAAFAWLERLERRSPDVEAWSQPDRTPVEEAVHLLVLAPLEGMVVERAAEAIGARVRRSVRGLPRWPSGAPRPVRLILAVAITELGHYVHHRASHEFPLLWRFHRTHHAVRRLSWRNATIFHPVDLLGLMACQELPVRLLGIDRDTTLSLRILKGIHGQLQHSNLCGTDNEGADGWIGRWLSTTNQHRWHHARLDRLDPLAMPTWPGHAVNYGAISSVWDRVFGTYVTLTFPSDLPIGLES
jgi:sterol desaturase/sphingolipid hydroxylase (fatty acid hydroxylase superfamily)